ncbi:hypothetical protein FRB95_007817 [Tulasnella sp. JGI-2019a]|nr:hypothetical protein FRB95_007817 [Tulasnella sp. JGI-2019a]
MLLHSPESLLRQVVTPPKWISTVDVELCPFDPGFLEYEFFGSLLDRLRKCRRRTVRDMDIATTESSYVELVDSLYVRPVLSMFNQLRDPRLPVLQSSRETVLNGQGFKFLFGTPLESHHFPILIALAPRSLNTVEWEAVKPTGNPLPLCTTNYHLIGLLKDLIEPGSTQYALLTDLEGIVVLRCKRYDQRKTAFNYEVVAGQPIRLTLAACLNMILPLGYMDENTMQSKSPKGVLNVPNVPAPSDKDVFHTCKSISDFDLYSLHQDRGKAEQFFRWKAWAAQQATKRPCAIGDALVVQPNAFDQLYTCPPNVVPLLPLPSRTIAHLQEAQRPKALTVTAVVRSSERFEVLITRIIKTAAEGSQIAAVYEVRVEGQMLCLKVFDDRLYPIEPPEDPEDPLRYWFQGLQTAEDAVRTEQGVYQRLEHAQGSVVPWYYGAHLFTLPDGHQAFGILMELVDGSDPEYALLSERTGAEQITFIESTRHAVRVFQYADISQLDWESTQILCTPRVSSSSIGHLDCVFIDFTSATQSDTAYNSHQVDDYGNVLEILCDPAVGLPKRLLEKAFEPREEWDYYTTDPLNDME